MNTPLSASINNQLTDIISLGLGGIFPKGKEPLIRTLPEMDKLRLIPHRRLGPFVYYDPSEVDVHIRTKLKVPAKDQSSLQLSRRAG